MPNQIPGAQFPIVAAGNFPFPVGTLATVPMEFEAPKSRPHSQSHSQSHSHARQQRFEMIAKGEQESVVEDPNQQNLVIEGLSKGGLNAAYEKFERFGIIDACRQKGKKTFIRFKLPRSALEAKRFYDAHPEQGIKTAWSYK